MKLKNSASNLQLQSPIKALLRSSSSAFENLVHFMLTEPHQSGLELQQSYLTWGNTGMKSGSLKVTEQGEEPRPNTKASAPSTITLSLTVSVHSLSFLRLFNIYWVSPECQSLFSVLGNWWSIQPHPLHWGRVQLSCSNNKDWVSTYYVLGTTRALQIQRWMKQMKSLASSTS